MLLLYHGLKRGLLTVKTDKPSPPVSEDAWRKYLVKGHALRGEFHGCTLISQSHHHCLSPLYQHHSLKTFVVI